MLRAYPFSSADSRALFPCAFSTLMADTGYTVFPLLPVVFTDCRSHAMCQLVNQHTLSLIVSSALRMSQIRCAAGSQGMAPCSAPPWPSA